jgi:hypothetical protein
VWYTLYRHEAKPSMWQPDSLPLFGREGERSAIRGVRGVYRGLPMQVLHAVPYTTSLLLFNQVSGLVFGVSPAASGGRAADQPSSSGGVKAFASAQTAVVCATALCYPLHQISMRLQMQSGQELGPRYSTGWGCVRTTAANPAITPPPRFLVSPWAAPCAPSAGYWVAVPRGLHPLRPNSRAWQLSVRCRGVAVVQARTVFVEEGIRGFYRGASFQLPMLPAGEMKRHHPTVFVFIQPDTYMRGWCWPVDSTAPAGRLQPDLSVGRGVVCQLGGVTCMKSVAPGVLVGAMALLGYNIMKGWSEELEAEEAVAISALASATLTAAWGGVQL